MLEIKIEGIRELERALKRFPEKLQKKYMGAAVKAGANVIAQSAKARCPISQKGTVRSRLTSRVHEPGNLKNAIKVYMARLSELKRRQRYWGTPLAVIKAGNLFKSAGLYIMRKSPYDAWYWHMVAGGHRTIRMGRKPKMGQMGYLRRGDFEVKGFVRANPFLRDAFRSSENRIISMITTKLNMAIQNARATL